VYKVDIGNKIRNARIAKGMTQEELGKILGVQKSAIAKYENGRIVNIKRSTLKKISDVLEIRPSELIFEEEVKADPIGTAEKHFEILTDGYIADFYDDFKSLSDAQKKLVAELIHNFAEKNKEA
jgi:transcriptional regulator with XRE-family HTH domain